MDSTPTQRSKKTIFGYVLLGLIVCSYVLFYPGGSYKNGAAIWRVTTHHKFTGDDLKVDEVHAHRNWTKLDAPTLHNGWVEFVTFVWEGDLIHIYLQKEGYFSESLTFTVPKLPELYGGQTYFTLARVELMPMLTLTPHI